MKNVFKVNKILPIILIIIIGLLGLLLGTVFSVSNRKATAGYWKDANFDDPSLDTFKILIAEHGLSKEDPIEINDALQLAYLSHADVTDINNKHFKIAATLDMGTHYFTPIGSMNNQVEGIVFDGGAKEGFAVKNLTIENDVNGTGLFGSIYFSTIKDLELKNVNITSSAQNTGAVAGSADYCNFESISVSGAVKGSQDGLGGVVGAVKGFITRFIDCKNEAAVTASTGSFTGGIFGVAFSGEVSLVNCQNNGYIKGINYVAGIGSGGSNSSAEFNLEQCNNTGKIESASPIYNYFAGLIAYTSTNYMHSMEYCYNSGEIYAPYGKYVAGLCAYGSFNIVNSYNSGNITGANFAAGIAADGIFEITKSSNKGEIKAMENTGNAIAAGIAARLSSGSVNESYNKGDVEASYSGISAGLIGSFSGTTGEYKVVNDCYNWGKAANAFIGESIDCTSVVTNSYNRGNASVTPNTGKTGIITHTFVYNYPASIIPAEIPADIYKNLSDNNPTPWGSVSDYNEGFPYLRSGWVSEIIINPDGGTLSSAGFKLLYANDLNAELSLNLSGIRFSKNGYTYDSLTEENIKFDKQLKTITANYTPKTYIINTDVVGDGSIPESEDGDEMKITFGDDSDIVLTANLKYPNIDNFSHWEVETKSGRVLFSYEKRIEFNEDFIRNLILNHPNEDTKYTFIAFFGAYRKVNITITGVSGLDSLIYYTDDPNDPETITPIGNSFTITFPAETANIYFKLTAKKYYRIQSFNISGAANGFDDSTKTDYEQTIHVGPLEYDEDDIKILDDIEISFGFTKETYKLEIISQYTYDGNYSPTPSGLVLPGSIMFAIDQTIRQENIKNKIIEKMEGYEFIGFMLKNKSGSYDAIYDLITIDADFLSKYLNDNGKVIIVAVYKRQFKVSAAIENGDLGTVTVNGVKIDNDYVGYFDEGTEIIVTVKNEANCEIAEQTGTEIGKLIGNAEIRVVFEKKKFKIEVYGINRNNEKIDLYDLQIAEPKSDDDNNYWVSYGSKLYIINIIKHSSNQVQEAWFYEKSNGELVRVDSSFIDRDGNLYIDNIDMKTINQWLDGGDTIKIVAKVSDSFFIDINLSGENQNSGDYKIEVKYEGTDEFVEVDKSKNIFKINTIIRITASANEYFKFNKFENGLDESLKLGEDGISCEIELLEDTTISIFFDAEQIAFNKKQNLVGNGTVKITPSGLESDKLQMGDNIVISYSPSSNHQIKSVTINGLTESDIIEKLNAQKVGDSLVIQVDSTFLGWLEEFGGELDVNVTTEFSKLLLTVIIVSAAVLLLLVTMAIILYRSNLKRRRQLAIIQAQHARTKAGYEAVQKVKELMDENKSEQSEQLDENNSEQEDEQ